MNLLRTLLKLDGFRSQEKNAFQAFDSDTADRFFSRADRLAERLGVAIEGMEHVPTGRGLLVANHAFGFDVIFPMAAIWRTQRRPVWVLGEHLWWKLPFVRNLAAAVGVVDGTRANVDRLLLNDELVLVLPGGMREAVKSQELRYQLLWGHRYGFVRAAIRNQAPVVPLASVGTDELFDFVGDPFERGKRWLGRRDLPVPLPKRILPIPHRVEMRFLFGEAIPPRVPRQSEDDFTQLRSLRREIEGALHELIEDELMRRVGGETTERV
jgi:1-acyl-sn-glycerol-3-phosphate acyltransferase